MRSVRHFRVGEPVGWHQAGQSHAGRGRGKYRCAGMRDAKVMNGTFVGSALAPIGHSPEPCPRPSTTSYPPTQAVVAVRNPRPRATHAYADACPRPRSSQDDIEPRLLCRSPASRKTSQLPPATLRGQGPPIRTLRNGHCALVCTQTHTQTDAQDPTSPTLPEPLRRRVTRAEKEAILQIHDCLSWLPARV